MAIVQANANDGICPHHECKIEFDEICVRCGTTEIPVILFKGKSMCSLNTPLFTAPGNGVYLFYPDSVFQRQQEDGFDVWVVVAQVKGDEWVAVE